MTRRMLMLLVFAFISGLALGLISSCSGDDDDNDNDSSAAGECACWWGCNQNYVNCMTAAANNEDQEAWDTCNEPLGTCLEACDDCMSNAALSGDMDLSECAGKVDCDTECIVACSDEVQNCYDQCPADDSWEDRQCQINTCAAPGMDCMEGCL